jgi:hypothetical protein
MTTRKITLLSAAGGEKNPRSRVDEADVADATHRRSLDHRG